ncbi:MAG: hypothetical protein ACJA0U_002080 [Salibacteraceae bacterium]|jgi:hypothetical protein
MEVDRFIVILVLLFNSVYNSFSQTEDDSIRLVVLNNDKIGEEYKFGEWKETGDTETQLIYMGEIKALKSTYKIMTSCWIWGLSQRVTSRILVFNEFDELIGNYYVYLTDLPEKIENNKLVFLHSKSKECDKTMITRLSFDNGIPNEFFLECKDGSGELYTFDKE